MAVECVMPGTEVLVPPGESVPLDGTVVAGESVVDESLMTGLAVWECIGNDVRLGVLFVFQGQVTFSWP